MPRILFIAAHRPDRSPSQRFRFEQYLAYFKESGFDYDFSYLISEKDDKIFYQPGNLSTKLFIFIKSIFKRLKDVLSASQYDIVFVQREAFMTGSVFFEKRFSKSKAKLIFDFDDAIWLLDTSDANKKLDWLKNPEKTAKIITMADLIFAGNNYLADYAKQFNKSVKIIPTSINTNYHKKTVLEKNGNRICIGWTGSITTIKHFEYAIPFLKKIKEKYEEKLEFKVIGDETYINKELDIRGVAWNKENEIKELSTIDIGIMPLPDDEWAKGKCGLKGLQYMALEIPTIMSPVGVNSEIISEGENGFLASSVDEWVEKISRLIESEELRKTIGKTARQTVIEKYSVYAQRNNYIESFKEVLALKR